MSTSTPFIGEIRPFGFNFAPSGWAFCNGQLMAIDQNSALFALIGTTYGGDGQTTFGLPDLRGRMAVSQGQLPGGSNYFPGEISGSENMTLLSTNLPAHTHPLFASTNDATSGKPANRFLSNGGQYTDTGTGTAMHAGAIGPSGQNLPVSIVQPVLAVNYCISLFGIFPSRN